jgi:hypothetical protein
MTKTKPF